MLKRFILGSLSAAVFWAPLRAEGSPAAYTLPHLLEEAERLSPAVHAAEGELAAMEAQRRQKGIYPNPRFAVERAIDWKYSLVQGWELPTSRRARLAVADRETEAVRVRLEQARLELQSNVKKFFYQLLSAKQRYRIAEENTHLLARLRAALPARYRPGLKNAEETLRVDLEEARTRNDLRKIRAEGAQIHSLLNAYLLQPSTAPLDIQGNLNLDSKPLNISSVEDLVLKNDSELRFTEVQVVQEHERLRLARASRLSGFEAGANLSRARDPQSPYFIGFEASIGLPVWDRKQGTIRQASMTEEAARERAALQKQATLAEVNRLYQEYQSAWDRVYAFEHQGLLGAAIKMRAQASSAYQQGVISLTDMLDSLRTATQAQEDYIGGLLEGHLALIELEKHTGGHL